MIKKFENFVNEHYNVNITTIDVNHKNIALDDVLEPGDVALLLVTDNEEFLDSFVDHSSDNPALKDRFTKILKIVK